MNENEKKKHKSGLVRFIVPQSASISRSSLIGCASEAHTGAVPTRRRLFACCESPIYRQLNLFCYFSKIHLSHRLLTFGKVFAVRVQFSDAFLRFNRIRANSCAPIASRRLGTMQSETHTDLNQICIQHHWSAIKKISLFALFLLILKFLSLFILVL